MYSEDTFYVTLCIHETRSNPDKFKLAYIETVVTITQHNTPVSTWDSTAGTVWTCV